MSFHPYRDDAFWDEVAADSEARRARPLAFAVEALESLFADADDDEALAAWRRKVEQFPWWAEDALFSLDAAVEAPDHELTRLAAAARLPLGGHPAREWLRVRRDRLRAALEQVVRERDEPGGAR